MEFRKKKSKENHIEEKVKKKSKRNHRWHSARIRAKKHIHIWDSVGAVLVPGVCYAPH